MRSAEELKPADVPLPVAGRHRLEQERVYFLELKATGNRDLREALILNYVPLVNRIARQASRSRKELFEDLAQVGYLGLIKAVDHFDPAREVQFVTYATHQIFGEIRHYLRDKSSPIKAPRWLKHLNKQLAGALSVLVQRHRRFPSIEELSREMNVTEEGVLALLRTNQLLVSHSLEHLSNSPEFLHNIDHIKSIEHRSFQLPVEDQISLHQAMETLRLAERRIIYLFFYYDLTQSEIGGRLGISQRQVSRIIRRALVKLKAFLFSGGA